MSKPFYTQESLFDLMQPAKWHGRYFKARCPFHDDHEPSFLVFTDGGQCLSLACQRRASSKQIYEQLTGTQSRRATGNKSVSLLNWRNMPDLEILADEANEILKHETGLQHYTAKRGIEPHMIEQAQLGWWLSWYTFPVHDRNKNVIGMMFRSSPSMQQTTGVRWLAPPGQGTLLYSPDWARVYRAGKLYVTFGIVDALALWKIGCAVISPTFLKGFRAEMLDEFRIPIYVVPDKGEMAYAREIVSRLGWRGNIRDLNYPNNAKDPAEYAQLVSRDEMIRLLL